MLMNINILSVRQCKYDKYNMKNADFVKLGKSVNKTQYLKYVKQSKQIKTT